MEPPISFVPIFFVIATSLCWSWNCHTIAAVSDREIGWQNVKPSWRNVKLECISNDDCMTLNSTCVENMCQCPPSYVFNAPMTSCLKAATAYGDVCVDTAQCTEYLLVGGNCSDDICNCVKGYHYLHGRCIKSSGLGEKCRNDDECYVNDDHEALSCVDEACRCSDGFYKREYRSCRREAKEIGAECTIDLDCTFAKNVRCDKKTGCFVESKSTENVTLREMTYDVRSTRSVEIIGSDVVVGSNCTNSTDCEVLGAATCDAAGTCVCRRGHFSDAESTTCIPELGENCQSNDTVLIKNSVCRDGRWSCKGATVPSRNNRLCRKVTTTYNASCQFDEQCYVFGPDANCVAKRCVCRENSHYVEEKLFCWTNRNVAEACEADEDCHVKGFGSKLSCQDSVCACPTGTHLNAAKNGCVGDTAALGDPCSANEDCSTLRNAICFNDTCTCANNYFNISDECVSGIGAKCELETDCKTQNSTCVAKTCSCGIGSTSPSADLCVSVSSFGGNCEYDVQCSAVAAGAFCAIPEVPDEAKISRSSSTVGTCTCVTGHHYNYERCYRTKVLNEPCNSRGECYVESGPDSVMCLKGMCTCEWNAVRLTETFCQINASSKSGISGLIVIAIFLIRSIDFAR